MSNYYQKYLKYKTKYLQLKGMGGLEIGDPIGLKSGSEYEYTS